MYVLLSHPGTACVSSYYTLIQLPAWGSVTAQVIAPAVNIVQILKRGKVEID